MSVLSSKYCVLYDAEMAVFKHFLCTRSTRFFGFTVVAGPGAENGCHIWIQGTKIRRLKKKVQKKDTYLK